VIYFRRNYTEMNDRMISEYQIGRGFKERGRGLIRYIIPQFARKSWLDEPVSGLRFDAERSTIKIISAIILPSGAVFNTAVSVHYA